MANWAKIKAAFVGDSHERVQVINNRTVPIGESNEQIMSVGTD